MSAAALANDAGTPSVAAAPVPAHVPADRVFDLDVYRVSELARDVDFATTWNGLKQQLALPDLFWSTANGGHWVVGCAELAERVLQDHETFSARLVMAPAERNLDPPLKPVQSDPPEWAKYRVYFNAALSPKQVTGLAVTARALAIELIEGLAPKGECEFIDEFALHLPIAIFMQIADLPPTDREKLLALVKVMLRTRDPGERATAYQALGGYALEKVRERRAHPGSDAISTLGAAIVDGEPISEYTLTGIVTLMLMAGMDTVAAMMGFFMMHLAKNPEQRHFLRDHPERTSDAVEEMLRRYAIVTNGRVLVRDIDLDGVMLKAGEIITVPSPLHNLDERLYPDPLRVDFDRKPRHLTFGSGVHRCAGAHLARAELKILLEEWLPRIPDFTIAPGTHTQVAGSAVVGLEALHLAWAPAG